MTFDDLHVANVKRCEESFYPVGSRSPIEWAAALAEEAGEVCRLAKRIRDGVITEDDARVDMGRELADVVMYADLLATRLCIDLGKATRMKFNEVSERVWSEVTL